MLISSSRKSLGIWLDIISFADWETPSDILATFGFADLIGNGTERVVFNIGGNKFRMICSYYFGKTKVHLYIHWIGTHTEYDKICKRNEQFHIKIY